MIAATASTRARSLAMAATPLVWMVVVAAVTGLAYLPLYTEARPMVAAAIGFSLGGVAVTGLALRVRRVGLAEAAVVSMVAVCGAVFGLFALADRGVDVDAVLDGIASGWARLFSASPPLPVEPELLTAPAIHVWFTATALVAVRRSASPGGWSAAVIAAAVGVASLCAAPLKPPLPVVLVLVPLGLGPLVAQRWHADRDSHLPWGRVMAVTALAVAVGALTLALPLPGARRTLRAPDELAVETVHGLSPLADVKAMLLIDPPTPVLEFSAAPPQKLLRAATLDHYDGVQWSVEGRFRMTRDFGGPGVAQPETDTQPIQYTVTVAEPGARFVTTGGTVQSLTGLDFRLNTATGDLLSVAPLAARDQYTITTTASSTADDLSNLLPATETTLSPLLRTDAISPELEHQLAALTAGSSPGARLAALAANLTGQYAYTLAAPSGHQDALLTHIAAVSRTGTPEQFAALGALGARRAGFPARVVVGWRVADRADSVSPAPQEQAETPPTDGPLIVSSDNRHAWIEVATAAHGWVPIDVTPDRRRTDLNTPDVAAAVTDAAFTTPAAEPLLLSPEPAPLSEAAGLVELISSGARYALPALAVLALGAIWFFKQRRRTRRQHAGHPADRVLGAWDELIDRLIEIGQRPDPALTPRELGAAVAGRIPGVAEPMVALAPIVDQAIHAPQLTEDSAAGAAWQLSTTGRRALRAAHVHLGRPYRALLLPFDPRPLVWNRVQRS